MRNEPSNRRTRSSTSARARTGSSASATYKYTSPRAPMSMSASGRNGVCSNAPAVKLSAEELHDISEKSNKVLKDLGPDIRWLQSYVTEDKIYCVYVAPDTDVIFEHARC